MKVTSSSIEGALASLLAGEAVGMVEAACLAAEDLWIELPRDGKPRAAILDCRSWKREEERERKRTNR